MKRNSKTHLSFHEYTFEYPLPFSKHHLDLRAFPRLALHVYLRPVQQRSVLDDGQSQPGTAPLFGVALIHTLESLEDPLLMLFGNADPVIGHADFRPIQCIAYPDCHPAAFVVIFDRILTYIVDHLV